ncbi:MAG: penicillin-binding protein activator, partial [Burkholderiales bacterium]
MSVALAAPANARSIFEFFGAERTSDQAEARARDGDYDAAADLFLRAAEKANESARPLLLLRAAECAALAQRPEMAAGVLQKLNTKTLNDDQRLRVALVRAELNQFFDRPQVLLDELPPPGLRTPLWVAARVWKRRAEAYFQMGQVAHGVHALVQRELGLLDDTAVAENHDLIWRALSQSLPTVERKQKWDKYDAITRGWLELAEIMNTYWLGPEELGRATADWQRRNPAHPANQTVLAHKQRRVPATASTQSTTVRRAPDGKLDTLALLLPLSGPLAAPAQAVREGFMAAYYRRTGSRPALLVFDTGGQAADIPRITEQALNAGADVIVGPLAKDQVAALAGMEPGVPVLALNYLDNFLATEQATVPHDFFQLGLLPED